ncbi:MAG: anion transporter, partial [Methylococcales bacterium]|nr:anion transporter [Methylococcales bacterium]
MSDNLRGMILAIIIGLFVYLIAGSFVNSQQAILLGLIAVMVTLWTNEVLPLGVVSLFPIVLFPAFDILTTNAVAANYSKSIIFLFLGGFMLAIAVEKTLLHQMISGRMLRLFPNTARGVIFSLALTSAVLSSFLSNTTTTLLLMPLALFLTDNNGLKMRFALAIAYGASIGGIITPIGTPPNLILFGLFEELKIPEIPFMQWVVLVLPLAMIMHFFVSWVLSIGTKNEMVSRKELSKTLTDDQKKVALALLGLIVLLVLNSP